MDIYIVYIKQPLNDLFVALGPTPFNDDPFSSFGNTPQQQKMLGLQRFEKFEVQTSSAGDMRVTWRPCMSCLCEYSWTILNVMR